MRTIAAILLLAGCATTSATQYPHPGYDVNGDPYPQYPTTQQCQCGTIQAPTQDPMYSGDVLSPSINGAGATMTQCAVCEPTPDVGQPFAI